MSSINVRFNDFVIEFSIGCEKYQILAQWKKEYEGNYLFFSNDDPKYKELLVPVIRRFDKKKGVIEQRTSLKDIQELDDAIHSMRLHLEEMEGVEPEYRGRDE